MPQGPAASWLDMRAKFSPRGTVEQVWGRGARSRRGRGGGKSRSRRGRRGRCERMVVAFTGHGGSQALPWTVGRNLHPPGSVPAPNSCQHLASSRQSSKEAPQQQTHQRGHRRDRTGPRSHCLLLPAPTGTPGLRRTSAPQVTEQDKAKDSPAWALPMRPRLHGPLQPLRGPGSPISPVTVSSSISFKGAHDFSLDKIQKHFPHFYK